MPVRPPVHRAPGWKPPDEQDKARKKAFDEQRGSAAERGYNGRWRKARITYLRSNPLCVHCLTEGKTTAASVVDHIVPHKGDQKLFWAKNNWQALCTAHHNRKTATEDSGFAGRKK